ncbi:MAG: hypothetical protein WD712_00320 [Candidatus Spechtbacterales bacterium]
MKTETIYVLLRGMIPTKEAIERLSGIPGVVKMKKLFPGKADRNLRSLYIVRADPKKDVQVLSRLLAEVEVEYAGFTPPRKLV